MKSIDEFWGSISEDTFAELTNKAGISAQEVLTNTSDPKNSLGNQIAAISFTFTKELLDLYHKWLCEQLDSPLED